MITIQFCGGAKSVTGGNYLIDNGEEKFLVECGLIQGQQEADVLNYQEFPYDPSEISFLIATHAHIDHIGRIPKLVKDGFRSPIYSTPPTKDFAQELLMDTVSIMKHDQDGDILFNEDDVQQSLRYWKKKDYYQIHEVSDSVSFRFQDAGHILGSTVTEVWVRDPEKGEWTKLAFSGDLGNKPSVLLRDYDYISSADYVLVEAAYGDRFHEETEQRKDILRQAVKDTIDRQSTLLVPTFSVERTQDILYELNDIVENHSGEGKILGRVGKIDVYLDSPLAITSTEIHGRYPQYYNQEAKKLAEVDDVFDFPFFRMTADKQESMEINNAPNPKMIMAGSGMSTGGRILHHERRYLDDPQNILLFVGYQAPHTLGRRILDGESPVTIHGREITNNIEVRHVDGYSAHADQNMLIDWVSHIDSPQTVFVVQGEEEASQTLATRITQDLGYVSHVPYDNEVIRLT